MPLTLWQILITVLLVIGLIFSTIRYRRIRSTSSTKIILIALRTAWILGLLLAFWEPTVRFERFEYGKMKIPILIDASASMQNFSPDTHIKQFLDTLSSLRSSTGANIDFEYFIFGDSTRAHQPTTPITFTDSKSIFPTTLGKSDGYNSHDIVIVSDGHWTKPRRTSEIFPHSAVHYLTLPDADPNPFVTLSHNTPETSPSDSSFAVDITASGYIREKGVLTVTLKEKNRAIKTETVEMGRGYFSRDVKFKTSNSRPGRKLYTVEATIDGAIHPSVSSFVHQTIPHFLTYSMYSAKPTLDRRYVAQALASDNFFRPKNALPDVLFLFDWDSVAAQTVRALPSHAAVVFAGCLPCASSSVAAPSITVRQADYGALNLNLDPRSIPPPQEIITCKQPTLSGMKRLLTATVNPTAGRQTTINKTNSTDAASENLMILFTGRFMGKQSLFCPVKGFWRWDFWPMSSDRAENELFAFSNTLLAIAKELLLDNISDQLILYPAGTLTETDSARFLMSLPSAVPIFEPLNLSLQIQGDNTNIDTAINYLPQGLNKQPISLCAMPPGKYSVSLTLNGNGIKAAWSDGFTVNKDMSELSVMAQNTRYLQEFAQPLDIGDDITLNNIFDSWAQRSAEKHTITETVKIYKSWLLLIATLLPFAAELVLRRVWGVD